MNLVTSRPDTQTVVLKPRFPPPSTAEVVSSDFYKILHSLVGGRQCTDDTYSGMPYEGACVYIIIFVHVCLYSAHGHVCVCVCDVCICVHVCAYAYYVYVCVHVCAFVAQSHHFTLHSMARACPYPPKFLKSLLQYCCYIVNTRTHTWAWTSIYIYIYIIINCYNIIFGYHYK